MSETKQRFVKVNLTVPVILSVMEDSTAEDVEFLINDSSSCADNYVEDFIAQFKYRQTTEDCYCCEATAKYVGEAAPEAVKRVNAKKW